MCVVIVLPLVSTTANVEKHYDFSYVFYVCISVRTIQLVNYLPLLLYRKLIAITEMSLIHIEHTCSVLYRLVIRLRSLCKYKKKSKGLMLGVIWDK